jgi:hypothetical protein
LVSVAGCTVKVVRVCMLRHERAQLVGLVGFGHERRMAR